MRALTLVQRPSKVASRISVGSPVGSTQVKAHSSLDPSFLFFFFRLVASCPSGPGFVPARTLGASVRCTCRQRLCGWHLSVGITAERLNNDDFLFFLSSSFASPCELVSAEHSVNIETKTTHHIRTPSLFEPVGHSKGAKCQPSGLSRS